MSVGGDRIRAVSPSIQPTWAVSAYSIHNEGRHRAVKIYFVARNDEAASGQVTQGVVERERWVTLKRELAADGFVVTYWCSIEDDVPEDVAA